MLYVREKLGPSLIERTSGVMTRGQSKKFLKIKKTNTEKYKKSLSYKGQKLWNALDADTQKLEYKFEFKCRIKSLVLTRSQISALSKGEEADCYSLPINARPNSTCPTSIVNARTRNFRVADKTKYFNGVNVNK